MKRVLGLGLGMLILAACASDGAGQPSSPPTGAETTPTTEGPESGATGHPCATMMVDPHDFVGASYPELEELGREDTDAAWLRVEGAVGCLVSLTAPGESFRARAIEGYVFDATKTPVSELLAIRVANAISAITSIEIADVPGAFGLVGEGADTPFAVVMEADGLGAYVQSNSSDAPVDALVAVARSLLAN